MKMMRMMRMRMFIQWCSILVLLPLFLSVATCTSSTSTTATTETAAAAAAAASASVTIHPESNTNNNDHDNEESCHDDSQSSDGTCQAASKTSTSKAEATANQQQHNATTAAAATTTSRSNTDSNSNSNIENNNCGLYLATSSIPNAGWGMYTGNSVKANTVIPPVDVVIPCIDHGKHRRLLTQYKRLELALGDSLPIHSQTGRHYKNYNYYNNDNNANATRQVPLAPKKLPPWLMKQYYWDSMMTHNYYDADRLDSIVPGLGMLANSHPGMILAENMGPKRPNPIGGHRPASSTPYQDQSFLALQDLPPGHEIFVEYGDSWFEDRFAESFPLSRDYRFGNKLAEKWQTAIIDKYYRSTKHQMWNDLATLLKDTIQPINPRLHEVMSRLHLVPTQGDTLQPYVAKDNPTAYASVPSAPQTLDWLQQEGLCLDHITVADSLVAPGERGAFASRFLQKGTVVAPAPVVHMSREHLQMFILDDYDSDIVLWKGHQLLLNYVYGHVDSSILFFPYSPAINLINHYKSHNNNKTSQRHVRPNVKLQWSSKMPHPEWLESWTPDQIMEETEKAGLVMEIVALEDIQAGTEIVLDYGEAWQSSYEQHMTTVGTPPDLPAVIYNPSELLTINDRQRYPSHVQTVCWIHEEQLPVAFFDRAHGDVRRIPDQWSTWRATPNTDYLSDTFPCTIVGKTADGAFYNVLVKDMIAFHHRNENDEEEEEVEEEEHAGRDSKDEVEVVIKLTNVPRRAITIVPKEYTSPEMRRDAFRHEIQLPEEMVPAHWRDLKQTLDDDMVEPEQCNLYMAESAVPNAGLGLYRGYGQHLSPDALNELDHFCEDMIIQVEDFAMNQMLRNRYLKQDPDHEMDHNQLLSSYAWSGAMTKGGNLEAEDVLSLAPGCGMLANAHPLLYNSHRLAAQRITSNNTDPSFGATTHYHHNIFVEQYMKKGQQKVRTLQNGMEILVKYGEAYFRALNEEEDFPVPFRSDYINVDKVLRRLLILKQSYGEKVGDALWMLLWNTIEVFDLKRVSSIMPKDIKEAPKLLESKGSAIYNIPDRVRSPEWLENHGSCADNIRPRQSTIELAGQGAFATRSIRKGQVVAPVPLIHLHRDLLDVYNSDSINDDSAEVFYEGKQLLLNYCYGHKSSSLLLFPYSPVVNYINHGSSKVGKANAKLQWSAKFNTEDWLNKSPDELLRKHNKRAGLAMDIVALRDIAPGEEIFIDYQSPWEDAWKNHTEKWNFPKEWSYEPPNNLWFEWVNTENEILDQKLKVQYDRQDKFLGCHVEVPDLPNEPVEGENLPEFEWRVADGMFRSTRHVFPCEIIERHVDHADDFHYAKIRQDSVAPLPQLYDAIITVPQGPDRDGIPPKRFISYNMPRRAIEVFDTEYVSPQFYRGAFRHEIGIPDEIFPKAWRNLKQ